MFGHDDKHQDEAQATPLPEPQADATLGNDNPQSAPPFGNDQPADTAATAASNTIQPTTTAPTAPTTGSDSDTLISGANDDLLNIKQKALQDLSPLVGHLDQSPEEKFRTTMMMIQASDDQTLIKQAYDAAQNINDDKVKAQALLDIVNEINYFTQQHSV